MGTLKKKRSRFFDATKEKADEVKNDVNHKVLHIKKTGTQLKEMAVDKVSALKTKASEIKENADDKDEAFKDNVRHKAVELKSNLKDLKKL